MISNNSFFCNCISSNYNIIYVNICEDEFGSQLLDLLIFIDKNHFWKAQIAQVMVDTRHELTLMPQVTKQMILFGQSTEIESKFKKLEVFYREVAPKKGWNTYNYVNLKYTNQIVCK